ncbi:Bud site selection protein, Revert to axial protein 1 [Coemansia thaxteri]|nr:Bud site selection protein, Revert to axial protein 1 [Coemansia thaxteri]KAJ2472756.1 Bud site selection protein, Revert to axial protein 1 [Coemansia sp. RSA 2322]
MSDRLLRKQRQSETRPDSSPFPPSLQTTDGRVDSMLELPALTSAAALVSSRQVSELPRPYHAHDVGGGAHAAGVYSQQTTERETAEVVVMSSLLDPHPIVVPPPGSRLAYAGATSREAVHIIRQLPTLDDTLLRQARAPLCLYNYWQYLADIESSPEELEFWLSLADYEELYRRYRHLEPPMGARTLRGGRVESGALGPVEAQTEAGGRPPAPQRTKSAPQDVEMQNLDAHMEQLSHQTVAAASDSRCRAHRQCRDAHCPFTQPDGRRMTSDGGAPRHGVGGFLARLFAGERASVRAADAVPLLAEPKDGPALEADVRHAAEQLFLHYFLPGGPSELYIGAQMRAEITARIERDQRMDAELFLPAKRHAYEAMRNESYLRFLRERLYHNTTRGSAAPRIALGLTLVFVALACQLSLIFLDVTPKAWRWLPMAGMWPGFSLIVAGVSRLDPFMALLGRYEPTPWHFDRVLDPIIRDSHLKRATMQLLITAAVAAILTLVMFLVPGHRL